MKIQSTQLTLFRKKYTAHGVLLRKEWAIHGARLTSDNAALKRLMYVIYRNNSLYY